VLKVDGISVSYGGTPALFDVSLEVNQGEIVSIVGSNGAGKSTILRTISGLLRPSSGSITFEGKAIHQLEAHQIVAQGIAHVPEGRKLFSRLNVLENLLLGAYTHKSESERQELLEWLFEIFPILGERQQQQAGTLSGGEQQMVAIARALMSRPRLLMLDEPSLGIMPMLVDRLFEVAVEINREGTTILLVEQNVRQTLEIAHRAYVLQTGKIVMHGEAQEVLASGQVREAFLGL
jgi:branched-chain amino acid transport system ATP-binding protein